MTPSHLILTHLILAPTQSPSYADNNPGNVNLPLSMDPVLAVVTNASGQQVSIMENHGHQEHPMNVLVQLIWLRQELKESQSLSVCLSVRKNVLSCSLFKLFQALCQALYQALSIFHLSDGA